MHVEQITLHEQQLVFLAAYLGEGRLIGIEDPFQGWLAEMVRDEWNRQLPDILAKGYLVPNKDDEYRLSSQMETVVRLCCSPTRWTMVRWVKNTEKQIHIFVDAEAASAAILEYSKPMVHISYYQDYSDNSFRASFISLLDLNDLRKALPDAFSLMIERSAFERFTEKVANLENNQFANCVKEYFPGVEGLSFIHALLCRPEKKALLTTFTFNEDAHPMRMIGLLAGPEGQLKLEYDEQEGLSQIRISSTSPDEILNAIIDHSVF